MKKILCFGDSNVYGFIPKNGQRYDKHSRWTGILQELSHNKFDIIEAGCNNRTGFTDNPAGIQQTGYKILPSLLESDSDCVILAIGINDLQKFYGITPNHIKEGIEKLINTIKISCPYAKIVIAAPSKIKRNILNSFFAAMFDETSIEKSYLISSIYEKTAKENDCCFIDLDKVANTSDIDGLHYEPSEHKKIAEKMFEILNRIVELQE